MVKIMELLQLELPRQRPPQPGWALWCLGFRPFYLLAALFALVAIPLWLWQYTQGSWQTPGLTGMAWHAHEMLYGYAVAVIAGFLLTAVRNWTGIDTPTGWPLAALVLLWLAGRILLPVAPPALAVPVDLAFLPALALSLRRRLRQSDNRRNDFIPRLLCVMALINLAFHLSMAGLLPINGMTLLQATLMLITTLEIILAGRVVPMFTRNAVPGVYQFRIEWIERIIAPASLCALLANLSPLPAGALITINLALAILHAVRWVGWGPFGTLFNPLLWVLHLGYGWIAAAFACYALVAGGLLPVIVPLHLLAIGTLGGLTIGMITRTALGHSGRPLRAGRMEALAYACLLLATLTRTAPLLLPLPGGYVGWLTTTGVFWCLAYVFYLWRYVPILNLPRADGKAG
jgi:uncharacterized protein involved in response to NO